MKKIILLLVVSLFVLSACSDPSKAIPTATEVPASPILATGKPAVEMTPNATQYADWGETCPDALSKISDLKGKGVITKVITSDYICFADKVTGESYSVQDVTNITIWYVGYEYDENGFTAHRDVDLRVGDEGIVVMDKDYWVEIESEIMSFDNVYPSEMDKKFLPVWQKFRQEGIDYSISRQIDNIPFFLEHENFSEDFTPSFACDESVRAWSAMVKIDSQFSFCEHQGAYELGRDFRMFTNSGTIGESVTTSGHEFSVSSRFPNRIDLPGTPLEIGKLYEDSFILVGCYPVLTDKGGYLYSNYKDYQIYGPSMGNGYTIFSPVGVVIRDSDGRESGRVVSFNAPIVYWEIFRDSNPKYRVELYSLPPECDFSK